MNNFSRKTLAPSEEDQEKKNNAAWRRIRGIKTTNPYTSFLANNYGKGRVGRHSIMSGRTAIVPDGFDIDNEPEFPQQSQPVGRSVVSDGAGIFNTSFLKAR